MTGGLAEAGMLRLLSCGSVDDGKSTLIGRLLHDCGVLYEDQLELLGRERTPDGHPDFSRLLDGLLAEQEQAITIDVAYRTFHTPPHFSYNQLQNNRLHANNPGGRRYLVADAPGHEQYTRNMVTGASLADAALLLIDAERAGNGLLPQTIRHSAVCALMEIPDLVVAVNKMDRVAYSRDVFANIEIEYRRRIRTLSFRSVVCLPVSALRGDNVCRRSGAMPWYRGPVLLEILEGLEPVDRAPEPLRLPVQGVVLQPGFRGLTGTVASGNIRTGQRVALLPSGRTSGVRRLVALGGDKPGAAADDAVCIQLSDDVDVSRGEMIVDIDDRPEVADQFVARMVWLNDPPLVAGRTYIFRLAAIEARSTVTEVVSRVDLHTLEETPAKELHVNDIGRMKFSLDRRIPFEAYGKNRDLGGFLLVDRLNGNTLGAGMIEHALRRSHTIAWHDFDLGKPAYAARKFQRPCVLWFTGLSASGKSTLANLAAKLLHAHGRHVYILDGDNLRHGLNRDLGFTEHDRAENIRRASEVARLMVDAGLIVIASFITPYREDRIAIRERFDPGEFVEIFVDTPLAVCAERDPKGLYRRAMTGDLPNFTGVSAPFEPPLSPELRLDGTLPPHELAETVVDFISPRIATGET